MCQAHPSPSAAHDQPSLASHQEIGRQMDLFHFSPDAAGCFWHPRGQRMREALLGLWREQLAREGFEEVLSPQLHSAEAWAASGHLDKYREAMFMFDHEGREWGLKPMSCPAHMAIFGSRIRSWRELPLRFAEAGLVHRNEPSGSLLGLLRARSFVQDDSHIFCAADQVAAEVSRCLEMAREAYRVLGLSASAELALKPEMSIGDPEQWRLAEQALEEGLRASGLDYQRAPGEGAFYGPKIDLFAEDAVGRRWQMGSVQLDQQLPRRLGLSYVGRDNRQHLPWAIHRAGFGSIERMIGILLEGSQGRLPLWCAPVGVMVIALDDQAAADHARKVLFDLREAGISAEIDHSGGGLGKRIALASKAQAPWMLIIGPGEATERSVQARRRGGRSSDAVSWQEMRGRLLAEHQERR